MRYLHRPHTFNDEIKSITSLLEGFDSCLELGGGWRKCNEPWETYELHPTCVMLYEDGGGGGEGGGGNCPSTRALAYQALFVCLELWFK